MAANDQTIATNNPQRERKKTHHGQLTKSDIGDLALGQTEHTKRRKYTRAFLKRDPRRIINNTTCYAGLEDNVNPHHLHHILIH